MAVGIVRQNKWPIVAFFVGLGFTVSGWSNLSLAIGLWGVAVLVSLYYAHPGSLRPLMARIGLGASADKSHGEIDVIRYDAVLWEERRIPHTTNTWVVAGPFCPHDKTALLAVHLGTRRPPEDSDVIGVTISHLYCPTCTGEFRLGAPEAGHMRSVGQSRAEALRLILDSKGPAAVGMTPAQIKHDLKLRRLPPDWLR